MCFQALVRGADVNHCRCKLAVRPAGILHKAQLQLPAMGCRFSEHHTVHAGSSQHTGPGTAQPVVKSAACRSARSRPRCDAVRGGMRPQGPPDARPQLRCTSRAAGGGTCGRHVIAAVKAAGNIPVLACCPTAPSCTER